VKAEVRGVPGSVTRIQHVEEKGVWEVEVEFALSSVQAAMAIGVVEISGSPGGDDETIKVPVYVR